MIEDVLGWAAILIAAIILYFYDNLYIDPILSLLITAYILFNVFKRFKETVYLFLQGVPADIDLETIKKQILELDHVSAIHHTQIWSQDGEHHVFSTHLRVQNITVLNQLVQIKNQVKKHLKPYDFEHVTIELDLDETDCSVDS
jgi:cobalt-zinc-cadmium efflux system protein